MSHRLPSNIEYRVPGIIYTDQNRHISRPAPVYYTDIMSIRPMDNDGQKPLNPNTYATRKTIAQGMLDIALLTANASQLRYVLSLGEEKHENYYLMIGLIVTSLVLQVVVGVLFLVIGALNINKLHQQMTAIILNNVITFMLLFISVDNVLLNSLAMGHNPNLEEKKQ